MLTAPRRETLSSDPARRRRGEERLALELPGFARLGDGTTFTIRLVDLSSDGCKVESPLALLPGLPLQLCVTGLGEIRGAVRWSLPGRTGLRFEQAERESRIESGRRHERLKTSLDIALRHTCGPAYRARVFDISPGGCRVELLKRPVLGEQLVLKLAALDSIEARVRWCNGFDAGTEFSVPLHPAIFRILIAHYRQALWLSEQQLAELAPQQVDGKLPR